MVPSTCPNTNPHCNHLALCLASLPPAISTLNRAAWDSYLTGYLNHKFVDVILNIIDVGASVGHLDLPKIQLCKNLRSALDHKLVISNKIHSLLSEGFIHGPFESPPLADFCCLPLGMVMCKCDNKCRIINHYSWPKGVSVNDETPDIEGSI